jgi:hypothetical protein
LRNTIIFGDGKCGIEQSAIFLQAYLQIVQDTRDIETVIDPKGKLPLLDHSKAEVLKNTKMTDCWTKPPDGWAKLNFDAGFNDASSSGSWGAILRDSYGGVILSAWGHIPMCKNAEAAEAVASLSAIKAVIANFSGPLHIENDCATLIAEVNTAGTSKSAIASFTMEIKNLLRLFPAVVVTKIHRSCNVVAYNLAKLGRSVLSENVTLGPSCVMESVLCDCNQYIAA